MNNFLKYRETINGASGRAYSTINGNVELMFYIKKLEANAEKSKSEGKTIGSTTTQHKTTGLKLSGNMTIYYITEIFRNMILEYKNTGKDVYFDIQVTNEDEASSVGKHTVVLKGVNIDASPLVKIDVDIEALEEDVNFTFEDFDILDQFGRPISLETE